MTHLGRLLPASAPAALLSLLALLVPASTAAAQTVVVFNDFEDGTPQGWIPRGGGVVLTNTDEVGSRTGGAGTHSLRTTGRTQGFHGPSLQTLGLLTKGATYQVTVWARLVAGQAPAQLRVTMQRTRRRREQLRHHRPERRRRRHRRGLGADDRPLRVRGHRSDRACSSTSSRRRRPRRTTSTTSASTRSRTRRACPPTRPGSARPSRAAPPRAGRRAPAPRSSPPSTADAHTRHVQPAHDQPHAAVPAARTSTSRT